MTRRWQEDFFFAGIWLAITAAGWYAGSLLLPEVESWILWLLAINVATFVLYGLDKMFASARTWRVSELLLWLSALAFGSVGALVGMQFFRHKTRKMSFQLGLALVILLQMASILWLLKIHYITIVI